MFFTGLKLAVRELTFLGRCVARDYVLISGTAEQLRRNGPGNGP